ncbi:MAG: GMC family oxidoreductase [Chloroflexota bacterium]
MSDYAPAEIRLARFLRLTALVNGLLYLFSLIGVYQGASNPTWTNPPFVSNAVASLSLLAILAWFASGDIRRWRTMVHLLVTGFAIDVVGILIMLPSAKAAGMTAMLVAAMAFSLFFGVMTFWLVHETPKHDDRWMPWMPDKPQTGWEKFGVIVFIIVGGASLVATVGHYVLYYTGPAALTDFFRQPLMVNGSAVKIALLGLCLLVAARDTRRHGDYVNVFILGNVFSLIAVIVTHLGINHFGVVQYPALCTDSRTMMLGALGVDAVAISAFILLKIKIDGSILDHTRFFSPLHFRALEAVAETLIDGEKEVVEPEQIVLRTDDYLASFPSKRLWLAKASILGLATMPLMSLMPPINYLSPELRHWFINKHFKKDIVEKRGIYGLLHTIKLDRIIDIIEGMMRFNMQLTFIGYYSNPAVQKSIGYTRFSQRPEGKLAKAIRRYPPLNVMTPQVLRQNGIDTLTADVVIIGSGAAGATLAEQMAAQGRDVLIIEKGPYVHPDNFSEDEVDMISRLYSDGALQISQSLRFTVLQGSAVGGSTVVNNAVCFDTPQEVLERWNDPNGTNAGIDEARYRQAQAEVRERLQIKSIKDSSGTRPWEDVVNPGDKKIGAGVDDYRANNADGLTYDVVQANITDCLGCGYCNIGCKYGRKLSMLDEVLPKAQQDHPDQFRIVSEAQVTKLVTQGSKVTEIICTLRDGRQLTIEHPNTVILSAGTIASSWLMMQSGIGNKQLPIGKYLCFNMGSPLHGLWEDDLKSFAGLQIGHYIKPEGQSGYVFETWYNPPIAQALAMPGWLDSHYKNMQNYAKMAGVGVLIGTNPTVDNAYLTPALFLPGTPDIVYTPTEADMNKLVDALVLLGQIMFRGGAKAVYASTRHYRSYEGGRGVYSPEQFDAFATDLRSLVKDERDILLGTGHPQGGNRISKNRGTGGVNGGVISPEFKVWGYDNLYVCDGSVHPSATTVNPQLTIMTMARYASGLIH